MTTSVLLTTLLAAKKYFAPLLDGWTVVSYTALIGSLWWARRNTRRRQALVAQEVTRLREGMADMSSVAEAVHVNASDSDSAPESFKSSE